MKSLGELKIEKQKQIDKLFEDCELFWAFSDEQFNEGKAKYPLKEGEKYASIGAGGYIKSNKVNTFINGMEKINKDFKDAMRENKEARAAHILYELQNYEAFYTGDISETLERLGDGFTRKEVQKVYDANYERCTANL
jgi:hypothetical protein